MQSRIKITLLCLLANVHLANCQQPPVSWSFNAEQINVSDWMITLTATLAPGWHIYSQHLEGDGPIPTSIELTHNDAYAAIGKAKEVGSPVKFYDSLYEMEIIWYTTKVRFHQKVKLNRPVPTIGGTVEFMMCNDHQCIPARRDFTIKINARRTKP